ncbi:HAD-IA family hydrolase [uncultured Sunxiuqinia sp.]|uniref:HAD-IA family hydrolase n=1 Tax=Sunxiuqinia rutila TaxID=1397841 RepID=UPI00260A59F6|nr:HAD-IA family hydrolase [uncultured Sunxiuqinia sp.]
MKLDKHPEAKALIFDLDGTLSDSLPVHIATWHKVCEHFNCRFDESMVAELTGMPTIQFAYRIISDNQLEGVDPEALVRMKQEIFWQSADQLRAHDSVVQLVHDYFGKIPLAVGTGASRKSAEMQLQTLKIMDKFDAIVTADDVTEHKPEPQTFLKCAELINVTPEKCHVYEDGVLGMQAAKTAGMFLTDVRPFVEKV